MTDHRQAIEEQRQRERVASASDPDAVRLAEVETAVTASKTALETEEAQMRSDGKYTDDYIVTHMHERKQQTRAYIDKLQKDVVDPIAKRIEQRATATAFEIPERTPIHIEASQHYSALDSDRRQEAIGRAVTGKDDVLAVALLTGRDSIADITREGIDKLTISVAGMWNFRACFDLKMTSQWALASIYWALGLLSCSASPCL